MNFDIIWPDIKVLNVSTVMNAVCFLILDTSSKNRMDKRKNNIFAKSLRFLFADCEDWREPMRSGMPSPGESLIGSEFYLTCTLFKSFRYIIINIISTVNLKTAILLPIGFEWDWDKFLD